MGPGEMAPKHPPSARVDPVRGHSQVACMWSRPQLAVQVAILVWEALQGAGHPVWARPCPGLPEAMVTWGAHLQQAVRVGGRVPGSTSPPGSI